MKIAIVSILALVLIFLSIKYSKQAKVKNDQGMRLFSLLFLLLGLNILVIGNAFFIITSKGWSTDNVYNFVLISTFSVALSFLFIGLKFFLYSKRTSLKLGLIGAGIWMLSVVGGAMYIVKIGNFMTSGWTVERQAIILNKCPDLKYKKLCYLSAVMRQFPNPEDYNKITPEQQDLLNKTIEEHCLLCDVDREKEATKEVEGLPDDF